MTRRDYEILAGALRRSEAPVATVDAVATDLLKDNGRFNAETFLRACGCDDPVERAAEIREAVGK